MTADSIQVSGFARTTGKKLLSSLQWETMIRKKRKHVVLYTTYHILSSRFLFLYLELKISYNINAISLWDRDLSLVLYVVFVGYNRFNKMSRFAGAKSKVIILITVMRNDYKKGEILLSLLISLVLFRFLFLYINIKISSTLNMSLPDSLIVWGLQLHCIFSIW